MTPRPSRWDALPKAVLLSAVAAATGAVVNFATSDNASPAWWIAVLLLVAVAAISQIVTRQDLALARKYALFAVMCLLIASMAAGDRSQPARSPANTSDVTETDLVDKTVTSPTVSSPARPPSGVELPTPLNHDSIAVADRLSNALRDANLIPKELSVVPDTEAYGPPLDFRISQGEFKSSAILQDLLGAVTLHISIHWSTESPKELRCGSPSSTGFCDFNDWPDGTRIISTKEIREDQLIEFTTAARPDNTVVQVMLINKDKRGRVSRAHLPLTERQLVAIATSKALSLK